MKFSLITVSLNSGDKLIESLESALSQTYTDFEVIVKDGGSRDGSLEWAKELFTDPRVIFTQCPDKGIYDAMNQAVKSTTGDYIFFLNCGDELSDEYTLEDIAGKLGELEKGPRYILYGNNYVKRTGSLVTPAPVITGFTCYRHLPCHQACFYQADLCREKPFSAEYKIRADYEHFLWCFYRGKAKPVYMDRVVSVYEGGGFSETPENKRLSKREHKIITKEYIPAGKLFIYRSIMLLTLAPVRTYMSESPAFTGVYNRLRGFLYRFKK